MKIGETMHLQMIRSEEPIPLKCKVVDIQDSFIYVDYPINTMTNKMTFLIDGTELKASFVPPGNAVYEFETEIVGRSRQDIPSLVLRYPGDDKLIRIQRREYVRVDTALDVAVHFEKGLLPPFVSITSDISGGGAAIIVPPKVEATSNFMIEPWFVFPLENGEVHYLKIPSKIIRKTYDDRTDRHRLSIQFVDISERDREFIMKYCFNVERNMRKKEQ